MCARPRACTWSCRGTGSSPATGIILRTPTSVLFVIPWGRHWIIGTTDTAWALSKAHPAASRTDIDYVLDQVNRVLAVPLTRDDVEGVYAGLRPLLAGGVRYHLKTLPRAHRRPSGAGPGDDRRRQVHDLPADGPRRRRDAVAHGLDGKVAPSCTDQVPLAGADGYQALWNAGTCWPGRPGCMSPGSSTCSAGTAP